MKEIVQTPDKGGLTYRDISVTTRDNLRIHGWLLEAEKPKGIVIFLHGNAENISTHIGSVYWLPEHGYDVLLMDYRGYGLSEGKPDFPDVYLDVEAMHLWLNNYAGEKNLPIYILGQSLGAAISTYYFSQIPYKQRHFDAVILDSVFTGHKDIARHTLQKNVITWPFQFVVPWFLPGQYNPIDHVANFSPTPLLIFHSESDKVLPIEGGKAVYEQAGEPKYWVTTKGPHIATFNFPSNQALLLRFLNDAGANPTVGSEATSHAQKDLSSSQSQK